MTKQVKSTHDLFIESLTPEERKAFEEEYRAFALSELRLALLEGDETSVKTLALAAGISLAQLQNMKSTKS